MMRGVSRIVLSALVLTFVGAAQAEEKKPVGSTKPAGAPLELTITGTAAYDLDLGGMTSEAYAKMIADAKEKGGRMPAAPKVALKIVVKNTSDKAIKIYKTGDSVVLDLELKGKGAVNASSNMAFTTDFRLPSDVEVEAGKSIEFTLTALSSGFRGVSKLSFWTAAGDYELIASWKTGVSPAPKGSEANDGFGTVTVTSAPFKIAVKEKK